MGRGIQWDGDAWADYCEWQKDKATLKRINALIKAALRDPFDGIGRPEPLKHDLTGLWSRRINDTDRLTYKVQNDMMSFSPAKAITNNGNEKKPPRPLESRKVRGPF